MHIYEGPDAEKYETRVQKVFKKMPSSNFHADNAKLLINLSGLQPQIFRSSFT